MFIGLTGSYGSGKSTVADFFKELGAEIIDADLIAREVSEPGGAAYSEIVDLFGKEALNPDGSLNRKKIADIVFSDNVMLKKLNDIIHPKVRLRELELRKQLKDKELVICVVPLLFENQFEKLVDRVIVVVVDDLTRIKRLTEKRKISPQEIENRLKNQLPQEQKTKRADFIIDNSGSLKKTREQVKNLFNLITDKNKTK